MAASPRKGSARAPVTEADKQPAFILRVLSVLQDNEIMDKIKAALYLIDLADE